jgi:hypothetical protein
MDPIEKMILKKIFIPVIIILIAFGCKNSGEKSTLWMYTHYSTTSEGKEVDFPPTSFLWLDSNGSYTRDFGTFDYGTWLISGKKLILINQQKRLVSYEISANDKIMRLLPDPTTIINFESRPLDETDPAANPFSLKHNLWRIKPKARETDSSLVKRLANHCQFWEAYFTWALTNNLSLIDVRSTPTPIKIYSNGFALKTSKELPAAWADYFYDDRDCLRSNTILEEVVKKNNIAWSQTDNKYKLFISAFQQMQKHLSAYKPTVKM